MTDSTFTLTRAPSPAPCPAADVIVPSPHTYAFTQTHAWNVSALPLSLNHYLPLFTFPLLPKKQYQTSCSPHWVHTYVHTHINTGPTSRLMLIWHHQRGVLGYTGLCVHTEPRLGTVLLLPHTNTYDSLTWLCSDFWNRMICLSLSSTLQLPDFKQTRFPLLCVSDGIYFSVWTAHIKPCMDSVASASSLRCHKYYYTLDPGTHQHTNVNACSVLQVWTQMYSQQHTDTHIYHPECSAYMWSLGGVWPTVMFVIVI